MSFVKSCALIGIINKSRCRSSLDSDLCIGCQKDKPRPFVLEMSTFFLIKSLITNITDIEWEGGGAVGGPKRNYKATTYQEKLNLPEKEKTIARPR